MTPVHQRNWSEVEWNHQRITLESWEAVYVVGDVHGCLGALERLLRKLEVTDRDLVVFVGDLVRKGPESAGVLERVREAPNFLTVRGNNEQKLLRGEESVPDLGPTEFDQLAAMPVAISWDGGLVVHGGVDPDKGPGEHTAAELQTMRSIDAGDDTADAVDDTADDDYDGADDDTADDGYDGPFWFDEYVGPPRVFFGHTVLERPIDREWAVGLDTGCVYGGRLTAYDLRNDRFVSVESTEREPRPPEKFLRPGPA